MNDELDNFASKIKQAFTAYGFDDVRVIDEGDEGPSIYVYDEETKHYIMLAVAFGMDPADATA